VGRINHLIPFHREFEVTIFQSLTPEFWIVWLQKNKEGRLFAFLGLMSQRRFSRSGFKLNLTLFRSILTHDGETCSMMEPKIHQQRLFQPQMNVAKQTIVQRHNPM